MVNRRGWLTAMAGVLGGMFALAVPTKKGQAAQVVPSEYDRDGGSVAQAYKQCEDGSFRLVKRSSMKAGDKFIMIGVDGDRLWRIEMLEVDGRGHYFNADGTESVGVAAAGTPVLLNGTDYQS